MPSYIFYNTRNVIKKAILQGRFIYTKILVSTTEINRKISSITA